MSTSWDEFVKRANELIDSGKLYEQEIEYTLELGREFAEARKAVLYEDENWIDLLEVGLDHRPGHPIYGTMKTDLKEWVKQSPDDALKALQALWRGGDATVAERISDFNKLLPKDPTIRGGVGTRARIISALLMGLGAEDHPHFSDTRFKEAYKQTGYPLLDKDKAGEAKLYLHALEFLDKFLEKAGKHGVRLHSLRHRLAAQSLVWRLLGDLPKLDVDPPSPKTLPTLAKELLLDAKDAGDADFLEEIELLLNDKRQVIFQGPPGTGKTYVAQRLAAGLAGSDDRVTLVQFHPSYAYEDFVRGFRPALANGQAGFTLQDGPLLRAAQKARADAQADAKHFLIIDEINRGNLAKVFGELYFLLEYRNEKIRMQYQKEDEDDFSLPKNLYIIGTMNTADRSIALVDLALRRRFYFIEFHPDHEPVKSVLRRWLERNAPDLKWVADVVDKANELLNDRHAAVGPSYFMKAGLKKEDVPRIWKHSVLPYIEERLFGDDTKIDQFDFKALCKEVDPHITWDDTKEQKDGEENNDAGA